MAKKKKRVKKNYINNKDLLAEVIESKEQGKMTDKFGHMMLLLVKRYSSQGCYAGYTYVDDMESYALMTVCKVWNSFNPEKSSNPFAYFTQTIKRAFWQYLHQEEKHRDIRDEMLMHEGELPSHTYVDKYEEKEFTDEFEKCKKDNSISPTMSNYIKRLGSQLVGYKTKQDSTKQNIKVIDQVCDRIEKELFDYDMEKTPPYKFINEKINQICSEIDPSYRTISKKEYFDDIEIESYDESEDYNEDEKYDE